MSPVPSDRDAAIALLRQVPEPPTRPDRFSSNVLFGQPGIYPQGAPMEPAGGEPASADQLDPVLCQLLSGAALGRARELLHGDDLKHRVPRPTVRTALGLLLAGPAEPVLDAFVGGRSTVERIDVAATASPGRVVGPRADRPAPGEVVVNERYRSEHPAVIAPSLAHALCHHGHDASVAEEATLHGLLAATHASLLARRPELADLGTELARRQSSLTISLLNARAPGSWRCSIRCPEGPGTIPGGNPALQGPDLWSIPFTTDRDDAPLDVPDAVRDSLAGTAPPDAPRVPQRYDATLGEWLEHHMGDGPTFGPLVAARAAAALGLLGSPRPDDLPGRQSS